MIDIRSLTRRYGATVAVDSVSFEIARGEVVGLLGHNGAGKTTLMKVLTGFLEPSEGTVSVDGHDIVSARTEAQRLIGYLPESAPLYGEMLVRQYVRMMASLRGVPSDKLTASVDIALAATDMTDRAHQPIDTLSKGLRQRVGIAQAIVHEPAVLVLDEPTNGLDPTQIRAIRRLVLGLSKNTTVLLSTHILQEIEAVCDRVLVMMAGKLVANAPISELCATTRLTVSVQAEAPAAIAAFAGVPGVKSAAADGTDPDRDGYIRLVIDTDDPHIASPLVAAAAARAGLSLGAIAPETASLERVFQQLEDDHIAGAGR